MSHYYLLNTKSSIYSHVSPESLLSTLLIRCQKHNKGVRERYSMWENERSKIIKREKIRLK